MIVYRIYIIIMIMIIIITITIVTKNTEHKSYVKKKGLKYV